MKSLSDYDNRAFGSFALGFILLASELLIDMTSSFPMPEEMILPFQLSIFAIALTSFSYGFYSQQKLNWERFKCMWEELTEFIRKWLDGPSGSVRRCRKRILPSFKSERIPYRDTLINNINGKVREAETPAKAKMATLINRGICADRIEKAREPRQALTAYLDLALKELFKDSWKSFDYSLWYKSSRRAAWTCLAHSSTTSPEFYSEPLSSGFSGGGRNPISTAITERGRARVIRALGIRQEEYERVTCAQQHILLLPVRDITPHGRRTGISYFVAIVRSTIQLPRNFYSQEMKEMVRNWGDDLWTSSFERAIEHPFKP
ncbi:MAG: hypothetical protein EAX81_07835 [Candidatus Thorarchaeota archaeon]|nr:hypothetical protein [Candidatus Thorarchaeota archaeon]